MVNAYKAGLQQTAQLSFLMQELKLHSQFYFGKGVSDLKKEMIIINDDFAL